MCIICRTKDISTLVNLTYLYCSGCPGITEIPLNSSQLDIFILQIDVQE